MALLTLNKAGKIVRNFWNYKINRPLSNSWFLDDLDDKHIEFKSTSCTRLVTIKSPFDNGNKCFVDTINGGFFCPKSGQFGLYERLESTLSVLDSPELKSCSLSLAEVYDYKRLAQVLNVKELAQEEDEQVLFNEALTRYNIEYPIDFKQRFYNHGYKTLKRMFMLQSGEIAFVDCPFTLPRAYKHLNDDTYHSAKLFHEDDYISYIPSARQNISIQSAYLGLFSWRDYKKVILVEDEFDAMALEDAGLKHLKMGVLPFGDLEFESDIDGSPVDPRVLPLLSSMNDILVWPTSLGTQKANLLETLDASKISFQENNIPPVKKLRNRGEIMSVLRRDQMYEEVINLGSNLALSVDSLYSPNDSIPFTRFSELNPIMGGFRKGELTLFSGHTGKGKTTFLAEYSIDLALAGVKTIWASFEMKLEALQKMLVTQLRRMPLDKCLDDENYETTQLMFRNLNMLALNGEPGSMDPDILIEKLKRAKNDYGIQHVVIDNLQYLLFGVDDQEMMAKQDAVIRLFREFATKENIHLTVVCHPRKTLTSAITGLAVLSEYDLTGRARAIQESDNVLIMQTSIMKNTREDWIQVHKCRHGQGLGAMPITFNPETKNYIQETPVDPDEVLRSGFLAVIDDDENLRSILREKDEMSENFKEIGLMKIQNEIDEKEFSFEIDENVLAEIQKLEELDDEIDDEIDELDDDIDDEYPGFKNIWKGNSKTETIQK